LTAAKEEAAAAAAEWLKDHVSAEGAKLVLSVQNEHPSPLFIVKASIEIDAQN
jgi:hypothetical protein